MTTLATLPRDLSKAIAETRPILLPVLLCIVLTQIGWVFVYDCTVTKNIFYFGDENSLGGSFWDGIANAASAMIVIALVSSVMITLAIFQFKKIVEAWLALSCICASVVITGSLFKDGAARLPIDETNQLVIASCLTTVYAGGALVAFFTQLLPESCQKLYMITNCASIATFYLTAMPGHTAWFLLAAVVVWDIFAVLSPVGPLKLALECAGDYGADTLRFMMFTAEDAKKREKEEDQADQEVPAVKRVSIVEEVEEVELYSDEDNISEAPAAENEDAEVIEEIYEEEEVEEEEELHGVIQRRTNRLSAGADKAPKEDYNEGLKSWLSSGENADEVRGFIAEMLATAEGEAGEEEDSEESEDGIEDMEEEDFTGSISDESHSSDSGVTSGSSSSGSESDNNNNITDNNNNNNNNNGDEKKSAKQALNSGSHLGFGDFIFYSILVGKSMTVGFLPAFMTTVGVITGLAWTLSIDGGAGQETLPALPISIVFGMLGHFSTVAQMAALEYLYSTLFD